MTTLDPNASNDEFKTLSTDLRKWAWSEEFFGFEAIVEGTTERIVAAVELDGQDCFFDLTNYLGAQYTCARITLPFVVRKGDTSDALRLINRINGMMMRGHWQLTDEHRLRFVTGAPTLEAGLRGKQFSRLREYAETIASLFMCVFANLALCDIGINTLNRALDDLIGKHPAFGSKNGLEGDSL